MAQDSANVPQADKLEDIVRTVQAVSQGLTSFQEIGSAISKVGRQGRYYRLAAQILGFIHNGRNEAALLPDGMRLLQLQGAEQRQYLAEKALAIPVIQATKRYIEAHPGADAAALSQMLLTDFGLQSEKTRKRRISTIIAWLKYLGIVTGKGVYEPAETQTSAVPGEQHQWEPGAFEEDVEDETLLDEEELEPRPNAPKLRELIDIWSGERAGRNASQEDTIRAVEAIEEEGEEEKALDDVASVRHQELVSQMVETLRARGVEPFYNAHIDLYAEVGSTAFLCEMKSCGQGNLVAQARRGLSQLYEYRYLHQKPDAKLVLVLESEPQGPNRWYTDYLVEDRRILVCWSTPGGRFACPLACQSELADLIF